MHQHARVDVGLGGGRRAAEVGAGGGSVGGSGRAGEEEGEWWACIAITHLPWGGYLYRPMISCCCNNRLMKGTLAAIMLSTEPHSDSIAPPSGGKGEDG